MQLLEISEENELLLEESLQDSEDIEGQYYLSFKHLNIGTKCSFLFSWETEILDG